MELTSIFEVVRIKQEIKEPTEPFTLYTKEQHNTMPKKICKPFVYKEFGSYSA